MDALIDRGADAGRPDRDRGNTARMGAAFKGEDAIAARRLNAGCDVNARNSAGQIFPMMAALFDRKRQIGMLLAAGADAGVLDAAGRSAASVVAGQGNDTMAKRVRH